MKKIVAFFIVFCFMVSTVSAELVYLKNLEMVDVRIIKEDKDRIEVSDGSKKYEIMKIDILRVVGREITGLTIPVTTLESLETRIENLEFKLKQTENNMLLTQIGIPVFILGFLYFWSQSGK